MAREIPYIAAVEEAIRARWAATTPSCSTARTWPRATRTRFVQAFGRDRVRVSPISETAEIGMAVGLALAGYRPVVELLMAEFMLVAMNQVVNEAPAPALHERRPGQGAGACSRPATGSPPAGPASTPARSTAMFMGFPGLKIALPSTPADAKGLMATAIRDDNPVVLPDQLPAGARARRRARGRVRWSPFGAGGGPARRRRRHDRRHRLDGRAGRWRRPRRWPVKGSRPR